MFRKRTSKRYQRVRDSKRMLHLNVNSPRIMMFKSMSAFKIIFKVGIAVAILCAAVWGVKLGADSLFTENQEYALKRIELETNGSFTVQRVIDQTRIKKGATLFALRPKFIEEKLRELPEVIEVKVSCAFPNTLKIEMKESVPVAWIHAPTVDLYYRDRKDGLLVGEDGVLFPCEGEQLWNAAKNLPGISIKKVEEYDFRSGETMQHKDAKRAVSLIKLHQKKFQDKEWQLLTISVMNFYTLVAEYSDEVIATYGMYEHERQLEDLEDIREHAKGIGKEMKWVDLRPTDNIPGKYKVSAR